MTINAAALACLERAANSSLSPDAPMRIAWTDDGIARRVSSCRLPVVLTDSITATQWPARTRWADQSYVLRNLPTLYEAYVVEASEAADSARRRAAGLELAEDAECVEDDGTGFARDPSGDLVPTLSTAVLYEEAPPTMYFARWFGKESLAPLRADAQPQRPLLIHDGNASDAGNDGVERRYFRLGTPGAVSSLHFDVYHNLFAQVKGSKRWWLLPPTAWRASMSFPRGHERARQSPRRPVFEWSATEAAAEGVIEAVTAPGELLYVPPMWLHQTVTTHSSIAVNVWSPSLEAQRATAALSLVAGLHGALGIGGSSNADAKGAALCVAARAVRAVATAIMPQAAPELLTSVHQAQWSHLRMNSRARAARSARRTSKPPAADPPADAAAEEAAMAAARACGGPCAAAPPSEIASTDSISAAVAALPSGVAELTLADLVTELSQHVASAVEPIWPGDKGCAKAVRCVAVSLQHGL